MWGEPGCWDDWQVFPQISTHSPRVGRTLVFLRSRKLSVHFNSLAPCGANLDPRRSTPRGFAFQLTRPVWGEPILSGVSAIHPELFQLTRPVWGEPIFFMVVFEMPSISTHSPRVGRTVKIFGELRNVHKFQLTRPVWGEPSTLLRLSECVFYFNSLAPCGANPEHNCVHDEIHIFQLTRPVWGEPGLLPY